MRYTPDQIAHVTHEANRALQIEQGDPAIVPSLPWHEETEETRDSAISGVAAVLDGGRDPEESHNNWCNHKRANGWVYGDVKDTAAKTHPCLVDYEDLPEDYRIKDELFVAIAQILGDTEPDPALDLDTRHPSVAGVARFVVNLNPNLPPALAAIAGIFAGTALCLLRELPDGPELTAALRKLLEAKDCAVRAALPTEEASR